VAGKAFGWIEITEIIEDLCRAVAADGLPDVIVGILRGGMVSAVLLAHRLEVRDVRAIDVTHTIADGTNAPKTAVPIVRNQASLGRLDDCDVLVIDDVAGSGATIAATSCLVTGAGAIRVRLAVCIVNEINWFGAGCRDPGEVLTYIGRRHQGWAIFPWEEP
jgi:uncharacterized protein